MADNSMPMNVNDQPGSQKSEQAPRPSGDIQTGSPEPSTQQAQVGSSGQRATAGRMPLFRR